MRTISLAMQAHLQGDVKTICTLWLITRKDNQVFAFTDFDRPITYNSVTYLPQGGYTHSQIDLTSDLSTSNMEVEAIFDSASITPQSLESGAWDSASVLISIVNYNDLSMGSVVLNSGLIGQITLLNGKYKAELRGLAQIVQQEAGQMFSPTCRAVFGDARCTVNLAPLTFGGTVQSLNSTISWNDSGLTQTGPAASFVDTLGHGVPSVSPYTIQAVPPTGGAFLSNTAVRDGQGGVMTQVGGSPSAGQYSVSGGGLYTFHVSAAGGTVFIDYSYTIGYFAYGKVVWVTGQNSGFVSEVKTFAPGVVNISLVPPYPINVGDTYNITSGCDRQFGTCKNRYNNVVHFRGEPYIPGRDTVLRPQG